MQKEVPGCCKGKNVKQLVSSVLVSQLPCKTPWPSLEVRLWFSTGQDLATVARPQPGGKGCGDRSFGTGKVAATRLLLLLSFYSGVSQLNRSQVLWAKSLLIFPRETRSGTGTRTSTSRYIPCCCVRFHLDAPESEFMEFLLLVIQLTNAWSPTMPLILPSSFYSIHNLASDGGQLKIKTTISGSYYLLSLRKHQLALQLHNPVTKNFAQQEWCVVDS